MTKYCLTCSQPYHPIFHEHASLADLVLAVIGHGRVDDLGTRFLWTGYAWDGYDAAWEMRAEVHEDMAVHGLIVTGDYQDHDTVQVEFEKFRHSFYI